MQANVIDTLHFASDLKDAGFPADQAEGLAQALNSELAPQMITPTILRDELRPINEHLGRLDAHVVRLDAHVVRLDDKIDALGARLDEKIEGVESRLETKIDAVSSRLDAVESKLEAKIDAVDSKLEGKFSVLMGAMVLGFTVLIALGLYNAVSLNSQKSTQTPQATAATQTLTTAKASAP